MGIVAKQSIWNTLLTYLGFVFGALNTLFLFTNILPAQEYGLVSYILATSNLIWPLIAFGLQNTLIKFFHSYQNFKLQSRFFSTILLVPLVTFLVLFIIGSIFFAEIMQFYEDTNKIVQDYVWLILLIGLCSAYFELFYAWVKVHLQTVQGNLIKEIFHRLMITLLLVLVFFDFLSISSFVYSIGGVYLVRTLLMIGIALRVKMPQFNLGFLENTGELFVYSFLILIAATVSIFLLDVDKVMIEQYMPIRNVAIYSICVYMASVVEVPTRAILQITNPLTAQYMVAGDTKALGILNKRTGINALVVTSLIALLIITNVSALFELIPPPYELYIYVVLLISVVKLFDAAIGVTNSIVFNSNYYRWILFFGVAILGMTYYLNTLLIPIYGITGAAIATFLAYTLYNLAKLVFVYAVFKIQPFTKQIVVTSIMSLILGAAFYYWDWQGWHPVLRILLKSILLAGIYITLALKFKLSDEFSGYFDSALTYCGLKKK